jgi:hypothetical protein
MAGIESGDQLPHESRSRVAERKVWSLAVLSQAVVRDCLTPALSHRLHPHSSTHQRYLLEENCYQPEKGMRHMATTESRVPKYQLRSKADLERDLAKHSYISRTIESETRWRRLWSSQAATETHLHCPCKMVHSSGNLLS